MYLERTWQIGLAERKFALILSHHKIGAFAREEPTSFRRVLIHTTSVARRERDLYSAFELEQATVFCFLEDQDTNVSPKYMQFPTTDLQSAGFICKP